ncbi:CAP domain-containing protein [Pseudonocardiaceae bacterium YIM PH 21723]|nr:CAP domain-containing protein [Pseudonocardiaceae bacterium YIM PH 21723]
MEEGTHKHRLRNSGKLNRKQRICLVSVTVLSVAGAIALVFAPAPFPKNATEALGSDKTIAADGGRGEQDITASTSPSTTTSSSAPTTSPASSTTSPAPAPAPAAQAPAPKPAPAPVPQKAPKIPSGDTAAQLDRVLTLVNQARSENGCSALTIDDRLQKAAQAHSDDMAARGFFDHTNPDGQQPWDRTKAAGYSGRTIGENIAKGQRSADQVFQGWMNSEGHRKNILNCSYKKTGLGLASPWIWTNVFGG